MKYLLVILLLLVSSLSYANEIQFAGYTWQTQEGQSKPGPNNWKHNNVALTERGLQFSLTKQNDKWTAGYISTTAPFLYGRFQITIESNFDMFDDAVVFSPYLYPDRKTGPDGTLEIDLVELSRWGKKTNPLLNFTQWPQALGIKPKTFTGDVPPGLQQLKIDVIWTANSIEFMSSTGARMMVTEREYLSRFPMKLFINLRFHRGVPIEQTMEPLTVTVTEFKYTPIAE